MRRYETLTNRLLFLAICLILTSTAASAQESGWNVIEYSNAPIYRTVS